MLIRVCMKKMILLAAIASNNTRELREKRSYSGRRKRK